MISYQSIKKLTLTHLTDEEIMLQVSDGNLDGLTILFDRYHLKIFNFFNKMTRNKSVSEDLTQDVFFKIMKYKSSYKSGNFASWIYTVARNIFSTYYQKGKKERANMIDDDTMSSNEIPTTNANNDELNHLQKAVLKLSISDRELIIMNRYQEIKYKQIAIILGSTEGAVKVRVHRALQKLKDIYFQNT